MKESMAYMRPIQSPTTERVVAVSKAAKPDESGFEFLVRDMFIQQVEGLLRSIMLSTNVLRIAVTWKPGFANTPVREEEELAKQGKYGPGIRRSVKAHAAGGVKKTIQPWSLHVGEGYTRLEYVERTVGALETYAKKPPLEKKNDKYEVLIAGRGKAMTPSSCDQLKACLRDVLTSLSKLHEVNMVHRDIRWDNVVYVASRDAWLLIDYETVWEADAKPICSLRVFHLAGVLEGDGTYSKVSDVKLVGELFDAVDCSLEGWEEFRLKLLFGHFTDATSALDYFEKHYLT